MNLDYKKKLGHKAISQFLILPIGLFSVPIFTEYLAPSEYGLYGLFFVLVNFIQPFIGLGLGTAFSKKYRFLEEGEVIADGYYSVFYFRFATGLIILPFLYIFRGLIMEQFLLGNEILFNWLMAAFVFLPLEPLQNRYLRSSGRVNLLSYLLVLEAYLYLGLSYYVLVTYGTITSLLTSILIARCLRIVLVQLFISKSIGFSFGWNTKLLCDFIRFGVVTVPLSIGAWVVDLSDRFLIGSLTDMSNLGYYQVANTPTLIPKLIGSILGVILFEQYSKLKSDKEDSQANDIIQVSANYLLLSFIWVISVLIIVGRKALIWMSNVEYSDYGYYPMIILVIAYFIYAYYGVVSQVLVYDGNKKSIFNIWNLSIALNILINIIFMPTYGIKIAAISTLVAYLTIFIKLRRALARNGLFLPKFKYKIQMTDLLAIFALLLLIKYENQHLIFFGLLIVYGVLFLKKTRFVLNI